MPASGVDDNSLERRAGGTLLSAAPGRTLLARLALRPRRASRTGWAWRALRTCRASRNVNRDRLDRGLLTDAESFRGKEAGAAR
jgi:hypothetical protein